MKGTRMPGRNEAQHAAMLELRQGSRTSRHKSPRDYSRGRDKAALRREWS
jgi:hypothetical protein